MHALTVLYLVSAKINKEWNHPHYKTSRQAAICQQPFAKKFTTQ